MEDLSVVSFKLFFFIETPLKKAWQYVCYSIYFILTIINLKILTKNFLDPTNLTKAQTLYIQELLKVIIVNKDENLVFAAF